MLQDLILKPVKYFDLHSFYEYHLGFFFQILTSNTSYAFSKNSNNPIFFLQRTILCCGFINQMSAQILTNSSASDCINQLI